MKPFHVFFLVSLLFGSPVFGQEYGTGEDSVKCIEKLTIYRSFRDNKEIEKAISPWQKAVELCPRASKRLYVDGEKFYQHFIKKAKDSAQKRKYIDSLMWVYDKRKKEYGEELKIKGKKGSHYVKYRKFLPTEMLIKGNRLLSESVHGLEKEAFPPHVGRYYVSLYYLYKIDSATKKEIALEYVPISHYIDQNIKDPRNEKFKNFYEQKIKPKVDKVFKALTDCEMLEKHYKEWLEKDSALTPALKKQMMLALKERKCQKTDLYPRLAKKVYKEDPSAGSAYEIGVLEMKNENHEEASKYFQEAIKLMKEKDSGKVNEERLAEFYIQAGRNANKRGLVSKANGYARKAMDLNSESPWPYIIIADAIAKSEGQCKGKLDGKGVYWLAADYAKKARKRVGAKDSSLKELVQNRLGGYRGQFPGKDPMFTNQMLNDQGEPKDEPYKIGCWIGETTRPRKSW